MECIFVFQKSMVDANEDDQIAAAIKASLVEKVSSGSNSASSDKSKEKKIDSSSSDEDETTDDEESWKLYLGCGDGKY
jgi:hypothetical protein